MPDSLSPLSGHDESKCQTLTQHESFLNQKSFQTDLIIRKLFYEAAISFDFGWFNTKYTTLKTIRHEDPALNLTISGKLK